MSEFKVGDQVRTLTDVGDTSIGTEGVIVLVIPGDYPYRIERDSGRDLHRNADEIELVEAGPPTRADQAELLLRTILFEAPPQNAPHGVQWLNHATSERILSFLAGGTFLQGDSLDE